MQIDTVLLPGQRFDASRSVCIVVDVLRASSSVVTLLSRGASPIVAAADIDEARALHVRLPSYLLCGEKDGLPPPGFHYGNSPSEFSRLNLDGTSAILATSNGTRILGELADAPAVLVGCLLNRTAVAVAAIAIARERGLDIAVVCSAAYGGSTFVLEDALGAGAIVDAALSADPALNAADAARFAADAFNMSRSNLTAAIASAYHAQQLEDAGLGEDVAYCSQLDTCHLAPLMERGKGGVLTLRA